MFPELVLLLGVLQLRTPQAKLFGSLLIVIASVQVLGSQPKTTKSTNHAAIIENSFRKGGALVVAPGLMEVSFVWKFSDDRKHMDALVSGLKDFETTLSKAIQDNNTLEALTTEVQQITKDIVDETIVFSQLTHELALTNITKVRQSKRSALALIGEIILGIQNESQRKQLEKLAHTTVDITKNLDLDEAAIAKMQNFLNDLKDDTANYIKATARLNNMAFIARRMLHHFSAKLDFLRGLLKGEILFQNLEVEQYAQLFHSTQREVDGLNLRWIENSLKDLPFTFEVAAEHIKVNFYITTQSKHIPEMQYFMPFKGMMRYNNMNYWITSEEHKAVAFDRTFQWSVSLSSETILECEKWKQNLVCPHLKAISKEITSCLEARYTKNLSLILHFCKFNHIQSSSSWIVHNSLLKHYGSGEPDLVTEFCTNSSRTFSDHTIHMNTNCFYDTSQARLFPSTIHHYNIVLDKTFASPLHLQTLTLQAKHKILNLNIGHVQTHPLDYYGSLNNLKWTLIPLLVLTMAFLIGLAIWVCFMIKTHKKILASICAATIEPEEFFGKELLEKLLDLKSGDSQSNSQQRAEHPPESQSYDSKEVQPSKSFTAFFSKWWNTFKKVQAPRSAAIKESPPMSPVKDVAENLDPVELVQRNVSPIPSPSKCNDSMSMDKIVTLSSD